MEQILEIIGTTALILLVIVGAGAGLIAGQIAGRRRVVYVVAGIVGAVALPFVLAALGLGILAAGGLLLLAVVSLVGAVILMALVRAVFGGRGARTLPRDRS